MTKIVIDRPRDPLAGMIASYRSAYARKWRVPVPAAASSSDPDGFVRKIRGILFGRAH